MTPAKKTVGLLTAGGDCPGLNAAIRAATARATLQHGMRVVGIKDGWAGLMDGRAREMTRDDVRGVLAEGGTLLGTSRRDPWVHGSGVDSITGTLEEWNIDALIVIGGDGTLKAALRLHEAGIPVVGVPKTIDNDIPETDVTFGFHTAVQVATDAIDRLVTTAEAHRRIMLVEVMGRTRGWIATYAGIAAGAEFILIPEVAFDLSDVSKRIKQRHVAGHLYSIIVVAEGVHPPNGAKKLPNDAYGFERLGGVSYELAPILEDLTGDEVRVTVLGHLQRGGTPTAFDRILATRLGIAAADYVAIESFGTMTALRGNEIVPVSLRAACAEVKPVDPTMYEEASLFFA